MKIYLDNAATSPLNRDVYKAMEPYLLECYGNPSSAHALGRDARTAIEASRRRIAAILGTASSQVTFTSGGTEADNMAICSAVECQGVRIIVTSRLEHHAVLNTVRKLEAQEKVTVIYLMNDEQGRISLKHLQNILAFNDQVLVSLMHGNNEIGNINDIDAIGRLCRQYNALFHCDTVQTIGHYEIHPEQLGIDYLVASAHKFNGPKGVGFLYNSSRTKLNPIINGGGQEHGRRAGTENVAGIVGLAKALELSRANHSINHKKFIELKESLISGLKRAIPAVRFNGLSEDLQSSLSNVLSVSLPDSENLGSVLYYLDSNNIYVSGGSACNSHATGGSHVLRAINYDFSRPVIRFSLGIQNNRDEIEYTVARLLDYSRHHGSLEVSEAS